jgi:hypothetical protein
MLMPVCNRFRSVRHANWLCIYHCKFPFNSAFCGNSDAKELGRLREVCEELLGPLRPADECDEVAKSDEHGKLCTLDFSQTAGGAQEGVCLPEYGDERPVASGLRLIFLPFYA